jgi:DNA sulfur modification protein DndC
MGIPNLAPIAHWRTCKVWDFLLLADAWWNWPFKSLNKLYGENGSTRFGCWMCTLVKEDKALQAVTRHREWSHYSVLENMRRRLLEDGRKDENRLTQPNGHLGRTSLAFREILLKELLTTQEQLGTRLISSEEIQAIQSYWDIEQNLGTPYSPECKFWRWQPAN